MIRSWIEGFSMNKQENPKDQEECFRQFRTYVNWTRPIYCWMNTFRIQVGTGIFNYRKRRIFSRHCRMLPSPRNPMCCLRLPIIMSPRSGITHHSLHRLFFTISFLSFTSREKRARLSFRSFVFTLHFSSNCRHEFVMNQNVTQNWRWPCIVEVDFATCYWRIVNNKSGNLLVGWYQSVSILL